MEGDKLLIEYNDKQEKETKTINDQELKQIKLFAEKVGKNELFLSDLEKSNQPISPNKSNKGLYISLAVVGILAVGMIIYFLMRNKKEIE